MLTVFKSKNKQKIKFLENKMYKLVEKKERKLGEIDEYGRDIVLTLRDCMSNWDSSNQRRIILEAQRYLRENQHYN